MPYVPYVVQKKRAQPYSCTLIINFFPIAIGITNY